MKKHLVFVASILLIGMVLVLPATAEAERPDAEFPPADWLSEVKQAIAVEEYHVTWQDEAYLPQLDAAWHAPNRAHDFRTYFTPGGIRVMRRTETEPTWEWGLTLFRVGREHALREVEPARLSSHENRIDYERSGDFELDEWYVNDPRGLEQGFTIPRAPKETGDRLLIDLELTGTLHPVLAEDRQSFDFQTAGGQRLIHYGHLVVTDAADRVLTSWMEGFSEEGISGIRLVIEDTGASYPIYVDPLATSPAWSAEGSQEGERLGFSVAAAGDVNGDGYGDVVIGAPFYDGGGEDSGALFGYHGSASGLEIFPAFVSISSSASVRRGYSVSTAGDVNADGYSDVVSGSPGSGLYGRGSFALFRGSETGLGAPFWFEPVETSHSEAGYSVSCAGDVNGDGYSDVIVGAPNYHLPSSAPGGVAVVYHGGSPEPLTQVWWAAGPPRIGVHHDVLFGRTVGGAGDVNGDGYSDVIIGDPDENTVYAWYGSPSGLGDRETPDWVEVLGGDPADFGYALDTAGDVNGDGYSDIVIGAPDHGANDEGAAYVFLGFASGLLTVADWFEYGDQANGDFGIDVATAGDVNGDGYSDVVIGAQRHDNGEDGEGRAYVYPGSSSGLAFSPNWSSESDRQGAFFGAAVATAGDVNGDGYSDVIIGASGDNSSHAGGGAAYVYHGSPAGLQSAAHWNDEGDQGYAYFSTALAGAGDFDGNGYDDVVVAAPLYDGGQSSEGRIYVYSGTSSGLAATPYWSPESNQAGAQYGNSVASAGDVNGDGFSDLIVGSYAWDSGQTDEGRVFLYTGSPLGFTYVWTAQSNQDYANFGQALASGDLNGDGFSDVVIGAPNYDNPGGTEGLICAYYGSPIDLGDNGTPANADWCAENDQTAAGFGRALAMAGDFNGDGYSDVVVGAPLYDGGQTDEGAVFAWNGSPTGPVPDGTPANADWHLEWGQAGARLGQAISWAGDVNNDGYSDLIVGAHLYDNIGSGYDDAGQVAVYLGSASGLAGAPAWSKLCTETAANCGYAVTGIGDVNGDGCSDIAYGAFGDDHDYTNEGAVHVHFGSASGVSPVSALDLRGGQANAHFGKALAAAGDVNGDGYADLAVGAPNYSGGQSYEGRAFVFLGNEGRARSVRPRQRSLAGDVIDRLSRSDDPSAVRLSLLAHGFLGRGEVRVEREVLRNGLLFDGNDTSLSASWVNSGTAGITSLSTVFGLSTNYQQHWRVRVRHHPGTSPYQLWGRWITRPWGGANEARFRTWQDSDGDVVDDRVDNCPGVANPGQEDGDSDGVGDPCDNCPTDTNPGQEDGDSDGVGDACETCTDSDDDGYGDPGYPGNTCPDDNCPTDSNPGQEDADSDGPGDACDPCTDTDADGYGNPGYPVNTCTLDNCPDLANPGQEDADADLVGDLCDSCTDTDADGFGNPGYPVNTCTLDNCPALANPGQENYDGDAMGDVCDPDADDDGWDDDADCVPLDETHWSTPTDPTGLLLSKAATDNLVWTAPVDPGTTDAITYDLLISTNPAGWGFDVASCVEAHDTDLLATELSEPLAGNAYYYLVRAGNACGETMGVDSDGGTRIGRACP